MRTASNAALSLLSLVFAKFTATSLHFVLRQGLYAKPASAWLGVMRFKSPETDKPGKPPSRIVTDVLAIPFQESDIPTYTFTGARLRLRTKCEMQRSSDRHAR